MGELLAAKIT